MTRSLPRPHSRPLGSGESRLGATGAALASVLAIGLSSCSSSDGAAALQPVQAAPAVEMAMPRAAIGAAPAPTAPNAQLPATAAALSAPSVGSAVPSPVIDAAIGATRLEIAPVLGVPNGAAAPLSRAMAAKGREIGLDFTRGGETHKLQGFFSINDDGGEVRVVYIWDVLENGRRVHRIQGQERIAGTVAGRDPWTAVTTGTMDRIGRATIERFAAWRRST